MTNLSVSKKSKEKVNFVKKKLITHLLSLNNITLSPDHIRYRPTWTGNNQRFFFDRGKLILDSLPIPSSLKMDDSFIFRFTMSHFEIDQSETLSVMEVSNIFFYFYAQRKTQFYFIFYRSGLLGPCVRTDKNYLFQTESAACSPLFRVNKSARKKCQPNTKKVRKKFKKVNRNRIEHRTFVTRIVRVNSLKHFLTNMIFDSL